MKKFLVFLAVTALSLAALSACGKDEGKTSDSGISAGESSSSVGEDGLIGFDVPETGSVSYGQSYTLPVFVVTDTKGNVYSVTYSVTNGGEAVTVGALEDCIRRGAKGLLKEVTLFDIYQGKGIPEGKKSVAFNLVLRADDRSLTGEEADEDVKSILETLEKELGAVLR